MHKGLTLLAALLAGGAWAQETKAAPDLSKLQLHGNRFRGLSYAEMNPAQQAMMQHLAASERTRANPNEMNGPFNVQARSPELGDLVQSAGAEVRFHNELTLKQRELAIMMSGRAWTSHYEWYAHRLAGLRAGMSMEMADALAEHKRPSNMDAKEEAIYNLADELLYQRRVSDRTFHDAIDKLGERTVVDVTGLVTYYEVVSMLLNLDEFPLPNGAKEELKQMTVPAVSLAPMIPSPTFTPLKKGEGPGTGEFEISSGRFRPLSWAQMSPEQKALAERLESSFRHGVTGPYITLMRSPGFGERMEKLGTLLSPETTEIDSKVRNVTALMATRHWNSQFEFWNLHRNSKKAAVPENVVEGIREGKRPMRMAPDIAATYDLCNELLRDRRVSDATFKTAASVLGERQMVNVTMLLGYYGMVSAQLALDLYPMPKGVKPELR